MNPQTSDSAVKTASRPLWRPEETFWQRYSPHHEFPLASVGAITLCGMFLGLLVLIWIVGWRFDNEADGPPRIDAVTLEGGGGGYDGLGTGNSPLGTLPKTEVGEKDTRAAPLAPRDTENITKLPEDLRLAPLTPLTPLPFEPPVDNDAALRNLQQQATKADLEQSIAAEQSKIKQQMARENQNQGTGGPPGGRNSPGSGGGYGGGHGTGVGPGVGPGNGKGVGRAPTQHEIHANRWKFYLPPNIDQHVQTLIAMGATYIFEDQAGRQYQVRDLKRTPAQLVPIDGLDPRKVVAWDQRSPQVVMGLVQKFRLNFMPRRGVITLPAEVEEKLANIEHEAMEKQGRREETVRFTHFDVRFVNGAYEPVVTRFE